MSDRLFQVVTGVVILVLFLLLLRSETSNTAQVMTAVKECRAHYQQYLPPKELIGVDFLNLTVTVPP